MGTTFVFLGLLSTKILNHLHCDPIESDRTCLNGGDLVFSPSKLKVSFVLIKVAELQMLNVILLLGWMAGNSKS